MITIKGLVNNEVFDELFRDVVLKEIPANAVCVVIGSFTGSATCTLGQMMKEAGLTFKLFTIDNNSYYNVTQPCFQHVNISGTPHEALLDNIKLCSLEDYVHVLVGDSIEIANNWTEPIDFIFIDGNHETPYVTNEILAWFPHMGAAGIISGHDFSFIDEAVYLALPREHVHAISDRSAYYFRCINK